MHDGMPCECHDVSKNEEPGRCAVQDRARCFVSSALGAIRTRDLCLRRATLYPAELRAQ